MKAERDPDDDRLFKVRVRSREEEGDLLVVLNVDCSGSMAPMIDTVEVYSRLLIESVSRAGGKVAVVAFGDHAHVLKGWKDASFPRLVPSGRTDLAGALLLDLALFREAGPGTRLIVNVSDGGTATDCTEWFEEFRRRGGLSATVHLSAGRSVGEDALGRLEGPADFVPGTRTYLSVLEQMLRSRH